MGCATVSMTAFTGRETTATFLQTMLIQQNSAIGA